MARNDQHLPPGDRRDIPAPADLAAGRPEGPRIPMPHEPVPYDRRPYDRPAPERDGRSLGDLFKELAGETRTLVRQEIQLAKNEAQIKAKKAGKNVAFLAAGGFVAYAGFIVLVMALGLLLGTFMPDWLGFLIAGAVVVIAGVVLLKKGQEGLKDTDFTLDRTAETLQEDKLWMKQEMQEVKDDPMHLGADR